MKYLIVLFIFLVITGCSNKKENNNLKKEPVKKLKSSVVSKKILRVGRISYKNALDMTKSHEKFFKYLCSKTGFDEARLILTPDYDGIIEKLKNNEIDICWLGTFAYLEAHEKINVNAVLRPVRYGKDHYAGIIIARTDSNINNISDLKNRSIGFIDKKSASGYLYPKALLLENNINPEKDMKVSFLKKHDNAVYAVLYKKIDCACVYDGAENILKKETDKKQIKIIAKTENIFNEPIVISSQVDKNTKEMIIKAFLSCDDNKALKEIEVQGFKMAEDKDYDYTRKVNKLLKGN